MTEYYTTKQVAELFKVDIYTVVRWARQGKYGAIKRGKSWYFPKEKIL